MAISFIGQASAAATTVTTPVHAIGDLIIIFAYRNTTTAPTLGSGFTSIATGSANSNSYRVGYRISTATNDSSGTWTNANVLQCVVYRGASGVGNVASRTNAASSNATIPALNLYDDQGNSWVAAFAGSKQTTSQGTPSGLTSRGTQTGTTSDTIAADTNGTVSSFSSVTSANGSSVTSATAAVEILDNNTKLFTASGTYTTGSNLAVLVKAWGGGGGGGGASGALNAGGGGGGGGAYAQGIVSGLSASTGYTVTVGAAGTAGTSTPTNGGNGGDSWFQTSGTLLAQGGTGGTKGSGATAGGGNGGAAGSSIGTTTNSGGSGGAGNSSSDNGGAGGGSGGATTAGGNASGTTVGAAGTPIGAAGGTAGTASTGGAGNAPGAGGGGAYDGGSASAGGAGAAGQVIVIPSNSPPNAPTLSTPADTATGISTTPTLTFTDTDPDGNTLTYELQIDLANTFDSQ